MTAVMNGSNGTVTASYHDTADRRLTRADIRLRRRMENGVGLWELTVAGRTLAAPGGPVDLPQELADVLVVPLRGETLVEVARLRTSDDVALLEGQRVLSRFDDERSALASNAREPRRPKKSASAVDHVRAYLRAQLDEIERSDPIVRVDDNVDAVHDLRVAARRARTILKVAKPAFDVAWADALIEELRWLGTELGTLRDTDVLLEHLRAADGMSRDTIPVVKRLERDRRTARRGAWAALSSERYLSLLDQLRVAVDHPPVHDLDIRLDDVARREYRRLRRTVRGLGANPTDAMLHRARIRAKRSRYAAELALPVAGPRAAKFVEEAKQFQDVVGMHQDAVVAEERIRALSEAADAAFGAGILVERQRLRQAQARADLPRAWRRLRRRGRKAWR
jgi:CHAD domain-containing protein